MIAPVPRRLATAALTGAQVAEVRALLEAAFGDDPDERFRDEDWEHALGGVHFLLEHDGAIVAHAAVVERELHVDGRPVRAGYVEAVATLPALQGRGLGTRLMDEVDAYVRAGFELGALGTGEHGFYERLGWRTWRGRSFVRTASGPVPTPGEDGYIMVLETPASPPLDLATPISCPWRPGDAW